MKKLSELISYKNQLNALSLREAQVFTNAEIEKYTYLTNSNELEDNLKFINIAFDNFNTAVDKIKHDLKLEIEEAERPWLQASYKLYENFRLYSNEDILNQRLYVHNNVKDLIRSRLTHYINWQHAAMFIRPGQEDFIKSILSAEPLYILDHNYDLLAPTVNNFNEIYKNRVRQCTIDDTNDIFLDKIPNGQIALCVAYMYFDYKPFEVLKQYFAEIYQKLKPGGALAFTFNDCDYDGAVKYVEMNYRCYTPGYLVKELAQSLGFEIKYEWHEPDGAITWLELKKPGELTSLKGGQILAKILPK